MLAFYIAALETDEERRQFAAIYEEYHTQMEKTAIRILKEQSDAEDAVQNAFLQIIRHFEKVNEIPCNKLPLWIVTIVKNEAISILRKKQKVVQLEDWEEFVSESEDITAYKDLVQMFARLPETYSAVLEMRLILGYTGKEIAAHLGISESAVNTRFSRGRDLLQRIIEREGWQI